jgi:hypothetical protein
MPRTVGHFVYVHLTDPHKDSIPGFDATGVESRIKSFLQQRCENVPLVNDREYITGICLFYSLSFGGGVGIIQ